MIDIYKTNTQERNYFELSFLQEQKYFDFSSCDQGRKWQTDQKIKPIKANYNCMRG